WDVRQISGKWLLWKPRIREVKDPEQDWFIDQEIKKEVEEFAETHKDFEKYRPKMAKIAQEPDSENLSLQELYDEAKKRVGEGR
ncbi:MAG: hypothetical protein KKI13_06025, partial [Candidatus Omnitrophica bacterium]|nr:hypothetical protein [Candidatus Omnitrophota bacterium]